MTSASVEVGPRSPHRESPSLTAIGITQRFGANVVLDDVSLTVGAGEAIGIVGPNGAGKTTLLDVLTGELEPTAGEVTFDGRRLDRQDSARRAKLGMGRTHQIPRPFSGMTVFENVLVGATAARSLSGHAADQQAISALQRTGLLAAANRQAGELGLLDRKRLELARALATEPTMIFLDEIAGGLTDEETVALVTTIQSVKAQGVAVIWIEHIVHVLVQVCPRLVCLAEGRVLADGPAQAVLNDPTVMSAYLGSGVR